MPRQPSAGQGATPRTPRSSQDPKPRTPRKTSASEGAAPRPPRSTSGSESSRISAQRASASRPTAARAAQRPAGRSSTRPGEPTRRRTASRPTPQGRPAPAARPRTADPEVPTGGVAWMRGAILLALVVMLLVALVPTVRSYIKQRNDIAAAQQQIKANQKQVADLKAQVAQWDDPAYIESQARERLRYVKPGERTYVFIEGNEEKPQPNAAKQVGGAVVANPQANKNAPWYGQAWQSVKIADDPAAGAKK